MLDVNEYGVVALDERALMAIEGGDGPCEQIAYAIGYSLGWLAHKVVDGILASAPVLGSYEAAQM